MPFKDVERRREAGREAARRWRERHPEKSTASVLRTRDPIKHSARSTVAYAKKMGKIVPEPCQVCGSIEVQAHHADYSRPLDVTWLCRIHHAEVHKKAAA